MKARHLFLCVFLYLAANVASPLKAQPNTNQLPFKLTVTKLPFEKQPDYFGGGDGCPWSWTDFPMCPVEIDGEFWFMFKGGDGAAVFRWKGTNIENAQRQPNGRAQFPVHRPYMLGGMWYDSVDKKLYAPMHCEYYDGGDQPHRQISLATSTDKGLTWNYEGLIVTRDDPGKPARKPSEFSGTHWDGGAGDFFIYVDQRGGYVYLYPGTYIQYKRGTRGQEFIRHYVARCAMSDKLMPGKWKKFYHGRWDEPGLGGKASYVNAYYVMYNTYLNKYLGFNYGNGISVCTDLAKQDWTPIYKYHWGNGSEQAWHVTDLDKAGIFSGGQTLYLYSYWCAGKNPSASLYKLELSQDDVPQNTGYALEGFLRTSITATDPQVIYPIEPLFESIDPIESRRARRVHCTSPETIYTGTWGAERYDQYFDNAVKSSGTASNTIQFSFAGADIYWRAVKGPESGKADVFIDDVFQKTVDCYSNPQTAEQIAFLKTGLATPSLHTIKIVVRGDKSALSNGTVIKHLLFEYSADTYRASDGFSSRQGKNQWRYQQKAATGDGDLKFEGDIWVGDRCELNPSQYRNEIGYYYLMATASPVSRQWVAPHAGSVRVEGAIAREGFEVAVPSVLISKNDQPVWQPGVNAGTDKLAHDFLLSVQPGDQIDFVVEASCEKSPVRVIWDPAITYLTADSDAK